VYSSGRDLVSDADVDALVLGAGDPDLIVAAAERGCPIYVVPPLARSIADAERALEAVSEADLTTCVGWQTRYSINLIQLRHMARNRDVVTLTGRARVATAQEAGLADSIEPLCDLVRYVGGPVACVRGVDTQVGDAQGDGRLSVLVAMESGSSAFLALGSRSRSAGSGDGEIRELSVEVATDAERLSWHYGTNHLVLNGTEWRVAEKSDGHYVSSVAAFLTAVETGRRSPVLSDYRDAVETMRFAREVGSLVDDAAVERR